MSMQTLTWDVDDAAAVAGNSDAYSLALATQARQKWLKIWFTLNIKAHITLDEFEWQNDEFV